jgi:cold shock CspA family protein
VNGVISVWNDDKGYGFITPDNQTENVFFHISAVKNNSRRPQKGDRVVFESSRDERNRLKARSVLLEGQPVRRKAAATSNYTARPRTYKPARRSLNPGLILLFAALLIIGLVFKGQLAELFSPITGQPNASASYTGAGQMTAELRHTLHLIDTNGPFPYAQDGSVFGNRERHLPDKPRGYYREYTVDTPGLSHRGARRVVTGGNPPVVFYYTTDHYNSFRELSRSDATR